MYSCPVCARPKLQPGCEYSCVAPIVLGTSINKKGFGRPVHGRRIFTDWGSKHIFWPQHTCACAVGCDGGVGAQLVAVVLMSNLVSCQTCNHKAKAVMLCGLPLFDEQVVTPTSFSLRCKARPCKPVRRWTATVSSACIELTAVVATSRAQCTCGTATFADPRAAPHNEEE